MGKSTIRNCYGPRIGHSGHCMQGSSLQRSMSDGPVMELYIWPCRGPPIDSRRRARWALTAIELGNVVFSSNTRAEPTDCRSKHRPHRSVKIFRLAR